MIKKQIALSRSSTWTETREMSLSRRSSSTASSFFVDWIQALDELSLFGGKNPLSVLDIGFGTVAHETIDGLHRVLMDREIVYTGIDNNMDAFFHSNQRVTKKYESEPLIKATCLFQNIRNFFTQRPLNESEKYQFVLIRKPNPFYTDFYTKDVFETVFKALPHFMSEGGVLLVTHFEKYECDTFLKNHRGTINRFFSSKGVWSIDSEEYLETNGYRMPTGDTYAHAYTLKSEAERQAIDKNYVIVKPRSRCIIS